MVTHSKMMLWHNIIGRLLKPSLLSEISIIPGIWTLSFFELMEARQPIKDQTLSRESPRSKPH